MVHEVWGYIKPSVERLENHEKVSSRGWIPAYTCSISCKRMTSVIISVGNGVGVFMYLIKFTLARFAAYAELTT
jgi:hypothetical protein